MITVAIVGGGFTGAAVAYHLAEAVDARSTRIVVFEPRRKLGAGLAYGSTDPAHRINVPASRMSLLPDDEGHFARWLAAGDRLRSDPEAIRPDGSAFPARSLFGDYVAEQLRPLVADGIVEHVRESVASIERLASGWRLLTGSGASLEADVVVLATTHPPPSAPPVLVPVAGHPRFVADSTREGALDGVPGDANVLVVGAGLTAADIVASLRARGHTGSITLLSRHGLRSRGHAPSGSPPVGDFSTRPSRTALALLRRVRAAVAESRAAGSSWHPVFDALRQQGAAVWQALPVGERRKIVRHLRAFWDVHRFRIAPQLEDLIDADVASGRVEIVAGRILAAGIDPDGRIVVRVRSRPQARIADRRFDALVVATGPSHASVLSSQPHLAALAEAGILMPDALGLGIACDAQSRAVRRDGNVEARFYVAGPLARGTFGELMGLPQVTEHAARIAAQVAAVSSRRKAS